MADEKLKTAYLKGIPADVYAIILKAQGEKKAGCKCQISIESTIYSLIRKSAQQ